MNDAINETTRLLRLAHAGDRDALGQLFDQYRGYLKILAQRQLDSRLEARLDASDIVQQTFLSAHRKIEQFEGETEAEFLAWVQRILERNVLETIRNHTRVAKRSVEREQKLTSEELAQQPAPRPTHTASQRAMRGEAAIQLARCIDSLPKDQREVVRLRHLEGWSLSEIASHLERTPAATAGLLKRGMQKLRQQLNLRKLSRSSS